MRGFIRRPGNARMLIQLQYITKKTLRAMRKDTIIGGFAPGICSGVGGKSIAMSPVFWYNLIIPGKGGAL